MTALGIHHGLKHGPEGVADLDGIAHGHGSPLHHNGDVQAVHIPVEDGNGLGLQGAPQMMKLRGDRSGNNGGQKVLPSDAPDVLEEKLLEAVREHFRYELRRPELMNRLGQNIVPFQFINNQSAGVIFDSIVRRVAGVVREEHGVKISLTEKAHASLLHLCTFELNDGGRGISNRIETTLINPLAHVLFRKDCPNHIVISDVVESEGSIKLDVRDGTRRGAAA